MSMDVGAAAGIWTSGSERFPFASSALGLNSDVQFMLMNLQIFRLQGSEAH